jgi:hypothetical protein
MQHVSIHRWCTVGRLSFIKLAKALSFLKPGPCGFREARTSSSSASSWLQRWDPTAYLGTSFVNCSHSKVSILRSLISRQEMILLPQDHAHFMSGSKMHASRWDSAASKSSRFCTPHLSSVSLKLSWTNPDNISHLISISHHYSRLMHSCY